jgi:hypothetical protein
MRHPSVLRTRPLEQDDDPPTAFRQRPTLEIVPRPLLPRVRLSPRRVRDLHRRLSDLHQLLREERDQDRLARLRAEYTATAAQLIHLPPPPASADGCIPLR